MNIKELISKKGIGWYLCSAAAVLGLIMAIILFATQKEWLPNNMVGTGAGVCLIVAFVVQIALTFFPLKFSAWLNVILYCIAFGIIVNKIPDAIAGVINNVEYTGGNFEGCMFYAIGTLVITVVAIVAAFMSQTKDGSEKF